MKSLQISLTGPGSGSGWPGVGFQVVGGGTRTRSRGAPALLVLLLLVVLVLVLVVVLVRLKLKDNGKPCEEQGHAHWTPAKSVQERESKSNQFIHAGPGVTQRRTSGRNPRIPARLRSGAKLRPFAHAWRICAHLRARFAYPNVCTPSESTWHWQWTDQIECEEAKKIQKKIPAAGRIGSRLSLLSYIYRAQ